MSGADVGPGSRTGTMNRTGKTSRGAQVNPKPLVETETESEEPPSPSPSRPRRGRTLDTGRSSASRPPTNPIRQRTSGRRGAPSSSPVLTQTLEDVRQSPWRIPQAQDVEVVVLYSLALGLERGRSQDRIADQETASVARDIATALEGHVRAAHLVPVWDELELVLRQFDPRRHVIFNLVESLGGRPFTEPEPPRIFQAMGFIHTGADFPSLTRAANKLAAKKLLESAGLPTPRYQVFRSEALRKVTVPLPAIVKPVAEGGSFGVTQDSLATTHQELVERVRSCLEIYRQPALAEEYVAGREINVAVWGNQQPVVLPVSEIVFQWTSDPLRQFVTFDSKWVEGSVEYSGTPGVCPAKLSAKDQASVESAAVSAYRTLGFRGFARVDMRLKDGIPYILEVNANPDLARDAGFFRSASTAGLSYPEMVLRILQLAIDAHYA